MDDFGGFKSVMRSLRYEAICPHCNGRGWIVSPEWQDWWNKNDDVPHQNHPLMVCKVPEEIECLECKGYGQQLTLEGEALMDAIRRWY